MNNSRTRNVRWGMTLLLAVLLACYAPSQPTVTRVDVPDGLATVVELDGAVVVWIVEEL